MKYCITCGKEIKRGLKFCNSCGNKLPQESKKKEEPKESKVSSRFSFKSISIIILVFVIFIGIGIFVSNQYRQQEHFQRQLKETQLGKILQEQENKFLQEQRERENALAIATQMQDQSKLEEIRREKKRSEALAQIELQQKEQEKRELFEDLQAKKIELVQTQSTLLQTKSDLSETQLNLDNVKNDLIGMSDKYAEAKPYMERVNRGQSLNKFYPLLKDYEDYTKPIILQYLGLSYPYAPRNEDELWDRAEKVYKWLGTYYKYCGDKGLRVGNTFYQFQFYSPDELLMSDNSRCGDCDDFSTLFAGFMYASGVPEKNVWMVCGTVGSGGGHCWNWVVTDERAAYRIDGVCADRRKWFFPRKENVDCFSEYNPTIRMNPSEYLPMSS
jgi:hypothetical protein